MLSEALPATRSRATDVALHGVYEVTKALAATSEPRAWLPEALNILCRFFELNDAAIRLRSADGGTHVVPAKPRAAHSSSKHSWTSSHASRSGASSACLAQVVSARVQKVRAWWSIPTGSCTGTSPPLTSRPSSAITCSTINLYSVSRWLVGERRPNRCPVRYRRGLLRSGCGRARDQRRAKAAWKVDQPRPRARRGMGSRTHARDHGHELHYQRSALGRDRRSQVARIASNPATNARFVDKCAATRVRSRTPPEGFLGVCTALVYALERGCRRDSSSR
jgi:hypothetical protein